MPSPVMAIRYTQQILVRFMSLSQHQCKSPISIKCPHTVASATIYIPLITVMRRRRSRALIPSHHNRLSSPPVSPKLTRAPRAGGATPRQAGSGMLVVGSFPRALQDDSARTIEQLYGIPLQFGDNYVHSPCVVGRVKAGIHIHSSRPADIYSGICRCILHDDGK